MGNALLKKLGSNQAVANNQFWTGAFNGANLGRMLNMSNVFVGHKKPDPKSYFQDLEPKPAPNPTINYSTNKISDPAAKEIVGVVYMEIQKILFSKTQAAQKGVKLYQLVKNLLKAIALLQILPNNQALLNSLRAFLPNSLFEAISVHQIGPKTSAEIIEALLEILVNLSYLKVNNLTALAALKTQIDQFKNLALAQANNQTNFVPGVLATGICKIIASSVSSARARASLISSDQKLVIFLESLMLSCLGQIDKTNPQFENSFVYYNCSELRQATFKKYPALCPKISCVMFENIAQNIFLQILAPALKSQISPQEMARIQKRYGEVLLYFKAKISSQTLALPELGMLEKLRKMLPA